MLIAGLGLFVIIDILPLVGIYSILVLGTWTLRYTIAGYDELFDVFDEETENRLKLYRSFDRPPSHAQEEVRRLFKDQATYETFQSKVRQLLFNQIEVPLLLVCAGLIFGTYTLLSFQNPGWDWYGVTVYPWTHIEYLVGCIEFPLILLFGIAGLFSLVVYMRVVSLFGTSGSSLRVWNYIRYLQGGEQIEGSYMSYENFFNNTSTTGQYIYRFSFRAVITLVFGVLYQMFLSIWHEGGIGVVSWILSIVVIPIAFLVLVIPQLSIHNTLTKAKNTLLKCLEEEHGHLKIRYMSTLREQRMSSNERQNTAKVELQREEIDTLRRIIEDTKQGGTWSFRMPTALKLLGASLIPIIVALIETVLPYYL